MALSPSVSPQLANYRKADQAPTAGNSEGSLVS
jgi:hypothetical protein